MIPNVIIGGTQKAGTTSLFRYLASHPSVCTSSIKETDFFLRSKSFKDSDSLKAYKSYFSHCSSTCPIILEASPQYLMYSDTVAKRMNNLLPDIKLIFILREPVSVLLSYIKFKRGISNYDLNLESFIAAISNDKIDSNKNQNDDKINAISDRLQVGYYYKNVNTYLEFFNKSQVGIFFYDDLLNDINLFMKSICHFINIDDSFYESYQYRIENKTRSYKFPKLHRLISIFNLKIEPFFNRHPTARNYLRKIYHSIFELTEEEINDKLPHSDVLYQYYKEPNRKLRSLLMNHYPDVELPQWLKSEYLN